MPRLLKTTVLDAVLISRPIAEALQNLFELYRNEINTYLRKGGYLSPHTNRPVELAHVEIGIDPGVRKIDRFPSIAIQVTGRNISWEATHIARESVSVDVFCCIQSPVNEQAEKLMYDFTDVVTCILLTHQVLPFYMEYDNDSGEPSGSLHGPSVATPSVTYGMLKSDNIKAGQISWVADVILHHPNLMYGVAQE